MRRVWSVLLLVLALGGGPAVAQYQVRMIETGPLARTRIVPNSGYFSVFLTGVYLNQQESFFRKNNIAIKAEMLINAQRVPVNIYSDRDPNIGGQLGIFNKGLIYMIPCTGQPFEMNLSIMRRDKDDPLKRAVEYLNQSENESLLRTFSAGAVPYVSLIGRTAGVLFDGGRTPPEGDKLFVLNGMSFIPHDDAESAARDRYALRDAVVVVCRTDRALGALALDAQGTICETAADGTAAPLRNCPWVAFRIQQFAARSDYGGREWADKFKEAMRTVARDPAQADTLFREGSVLLAADKDFTDTDKLAIEGKTRKALDAARRLVANGDAAMVAAAMERACVPARPLGNGVTPDSADITLAPAASWERLGTPPSTPGTVKSTGLDARALTTPLVFSPDRFLALLGEE